jgi:hypothetical protein
MARARECEYMVQEHNLVQRDYGKLSMYSILLLMLLMHQLTADYMSYNGYNTSETQIGLMVADSNYSNFLVKGSLTDGQSISPNGTTTNYKGQIGYLPASFVTIIQFISPTPSTGAIQYIPQNYVTFKVYSDNLLTSSNLNLSGVIYPLTQTSTYIWSITLTGIPVGIYNYNVYGIDIVGNPTSTETRTITIKSQVLGNLSLSVTSNQTYYDIGDTILIWCDASRNSTVNEIWIFSSDGTSYNMTYLITKNMWYVYYKVKQKQEYIIANSYSSSLGSTGFGDIVITINPNPSTQSQWNLILVNLSFLGASGAVVVVIIVVILIILIIAKMFVVDRLTPKPLAPLNPGRTSVIGKVGSASMSGFEGIRNSVGFIFQIIFMIVTIIIIISIILVILFVLRTLHIL